MDTQPDSATSNPRTKVILSPSARFRRTVFTVVLAYRWFGTVQRSRTTIDFVVTLPALSRAVRVSFARTFLP